MAPLTRDTADAKAVSKRESKRLGAPIRKSLGDLKRSGPLSFCVGFIESSSVVYSFVLKRFNIRLMRLY